MQSMNISLPDPLKEFVEGQIASGRYSSASEYVRKLIREDERRKAGERLEALLLEGLRGTKANSRARTGPRFGKRLWHRYRRESS